MSGLRPMRSFSLVFCFGGAKAFSRRTALNSFQASVERPSVLPGLQSRIKPMSEELIQDRLFNSPLLNGCPEKDWRTDSGYSVPSVWILTAWQSVHRLLGTRVPKIAHWRVRTVTTVGARQGKMDRAPYRMSDKRRRFSTGVMLSVSDPSQLEHLGECASIRYASLCHVHVDGYRSDLTVLGLRGSNCITSYRCAWTVAGAARNLAVQFADPPGVTYCNDYGLQIYESVVMT
ncbi:hypothetical protein DFP72DRAFT_845813 [Ephemerocybe angulata]|uniref:Uncharacterized protein n=1 Tax=Ephemerocybe angulata TaxID=980116 RepID=A0A8H6I3P1_9AGAR|nr:hypothetical protein DFP72DRAFT_845813 [Tulosesus angulatus]